jgi:hypothetical protein
MYLITHSCGSELPCSFQSVYVTYIIQNWGWKKNIPPKHMYFTRWQRHQESNRSSPRLSAFLDFTYTSKKDVVRLAETSVYCYQSTWSHVPKLLVYWLPEISDMIADRAGEILVSSGASEGKWETLRQWKPEVWFGTMVKWCSFTTEGIWNVIIVRRTFFLFLW